MEQQITPGVRILNGFLSVLIVALVGILLSVAVALILWAVGVF